MNKPTWEINFDDVNTIEDIKDILKTLRMGFNGDLQDFKQIQHLLVLRYPTEDLK